MSDLLIPAPLQHSYLKGFPPPKITELRSWQRGLLSREEWKRHLSCVIVAPTSGGKTLIAEVAIAQLLDDNPLAKAIYALPFVALAAEKTHDFEKRFPRFCVRGFFQNVGGTDFAQGSIAICTYEKAHSVLNSAIRNRYVSKIKLVIVDEVHMIGDESRGVVAESLIMKLRLLFPTPRVVALTATLSQSDGVKLAQSMGGFCHFSASRPSELAHYVCCTMDGALKQIQNGELIEILHLKTIKEDVNYLIPLVRVIVCNNDATVLIFVNSRNDTRNVAKFLTRDLEREIDGLPALVQPSEELTNQRNKLVLDLKKTVSDVDQVLVAGIRKGVGFHHAGLLLDERRIVEHGIKSATLFVVVATTTLSAGVNIRNVRRVIIYSPYRTSGRTKTLISPSLFVQMAGRSGQNDKVAML
jgi:replicative superfamily II helicase